jgi:hypothetical protein
VVRIEENFRNGFLGVETLTLKCFITEFDLQQVLYLIFAIIG